MKENWFHFNVKGDNPKEDSSSYLEEILIGFIILFVILFIFNGGYIPSIFFFGFEIVAIFIFFHFFILAWEMLNEFNEDSESDSASYISAIFKTNDIKKIDYLIFIVLGVFIASLFTIPFQSWQLYHSYLLAITGISLAYLIIFHSKISKVYAGIAFLFFILAIFLLLIQYEIIHIAFCNSCNNFSDFNSDLALWNPVNIRLLLLKISIAGIAMFILSGFFYLFFDQSYFLKVVVALSFFISIICIAIYYIMGMNQIPY